MKKLIFLSVIFLSVAANAGHHKKNELSNEEIVMEAYSTFAKGDTESWAKLHTDDLVFTIYGNLPQSGKHIGTEATVRDAFDVIATHWPKFQVEKINIDTVGNTVYVLNHMTADNLDTYSMHVFKIRDRKIESFTAYDDTDSMRSSMVK